MDSFAGHETGARVSTLWGYPRGIFLLSFTEFWERFSYWGMMALLVLFLTASPASGGFGWNQADALKLYGYYSGLIFTLPIAGGWLANRYWGERRCIRAGATLVVMGHASLAAPGLLPALARHVAVIEPSWVHRASVGFFFAGLILLVGGTGLLKPTISSIVSRFYGKNDKRRDGAFALFFLGIYLGAIVANIVVGFIGERVSWHWGFGTAGFGMAFGLCIYRWKERDYLGEIGVAPVARPSDPRKRIRFTREERDRISVILIQGLFTVLYAAAFYQKGGLLTLFTKDHLDRHVGAWEIPTTWLLSVSTLTFVVVSPFLARFWARLGARGLDPSASIKLAWGLMIIGAGYLVVAHAAAARELGQAAKPSWMWIAFTYVAFGLADALVWPNQISLTTKLAPRHLSALFVGGWYVTIGLGSWLTGYIGALGFVWGLRPLFLALAASLVGLGAALWALTPILKRRMHGAEG